MVFRNCWLGQPIKIHIKINPTITVPLLIDSTVKNTFSKVCSTFPTFRVEIPGGAFYFHYRRSQQPILNRFAMRDDSRNTTPLSRISIENTISVKMTGLLLKRIQWRRYDTGAGTILEKVRYWRRYDTGEGTILEQVRYWIPWI